MGTLSLSWLITLLTRVGGQGSGIALEVLRRDVQIPINHFQIEILKLVEILSWDTTHTRDVLIRKVNIVVELGCYEHSGENQSKIKHKLDLE